MTTSSTALIAAAQDTTLKARAVALGSMLGMMENEVSASWRNILVTNADNSGKEKIGDVYARALKQRELALAAVPPPVGEDVTAVTDEHLLFALRQALKDKKPNN